MPVLGQLNIARLKVGWEDPVFADFRDALDPVNAAAETSPGFVWRLVDSAQEHPDLAAFEAEGWLVNLTAWESVEALRDFVRSPAHLAIMQRRGEWFEAVETHLVLWWLPDGERPTFHEAMARLRGLRAEGPTPSAFDFRRSFPPVQLADGKCYSDAPQTGSNEPP